MIAALLIDIVDAVRAEGAGMASAIKEKLPVAEGNLKASILDRIEVHGSMIRLTISADPHFQFVENGRRAGARMPPLPPIRRWLQVKGLDVRLAFPVAKAISERGIKPKHILKDIVEARQEGIAAKIRKAFGEAIKVEFSNLVTRTLEKAA